MARYEIKIQTTGADAAASELKKTADGLQNVSKQAKTTSEQTDKLTSSKGKLVDALKKALREFPLIASAVDGLRNPFMIITTLVGGAALAFGKLKERMAELPSLFGNAGRAVETHSDKLSDYAKAIASVNDGLKDMKAFFDGANTALQRQIDLIDENKQGILELQQAQAEVDKLKVDRDEKDPVKRAQAKRAIDERLAGVKLGLAGTAGQKVAILDQQIQREQEFQVAAQQEIPRREGLVSAVTNFQDARTALGAATTANRERFARREVLNMAARADGTYDFSPQDYEYLRQIGVVTDAGAIDKARAAQFLPAEEAGLKLTRERLDAARAAFGSARAALPAGISRMEDIDPFLDAANASAAGVQNESYRRQEDLMMRRDGLLRGQSVDIEMGRIGVERARIQGDISERDAQEQKDREQRDEENKRVRKGKGFGMIDDAGGSGSVGGAAASVVNAIDNNTQVIVSALNTIRAAVSSQSAQIAAQGQAIQSVNRGMESTSQAVS